MIAPEWRGDRGLAPPGWRQGVTPGGYRRGRGAGRCIPQAFVADSPPRRSPSTAKQFVVELAMQGAVAKRCVAPDSRSLGIANKSKTRTTHDPSGGPAHKISLTSRFG
jgi:hypothetical protein